MGGEAPGVLKRTARIGNGFVPLGAGPARYRALWEQIADLAESEGRDPAAITRAVHLYCCLDDDPGKAHATVERTLTERYGFEVTLTEPDAFLIGDTGHCARIIESHLETGVQHFVINIARGLEEVPDTMLRLAHEVLPRFR